jgi:probable HAF family extracellular repeat protein
MKPIITAILVGSLATTLVNAQGPRYKLRDLGPLPGGTFSQATGIADAGFVPGLSATNDGVQHAVVWIHGHAIDIVSARREALNSAAFAVNVHGQVSMQTETTNADPYGEDFCGYGSHRTCRAARWQYGMVRKLRTLGGNNATVGNINDLGLIVGTAETAVADAACAATQPFQILQYRPVIWGTHPGDVRPLPLLRSDTVGVASWINDKGQAVGYSGSCANSALLPLPFGAHAVLWERDGSIHDLGNLGAAAVNIALAINDRGQVVGASSLAADSTPFDRTNAFLWTKKDGMRDLGTLPGDVHSGATAINDAGEIVGVSGDGAGNIRAFHWQDGSMEDLNTLVPADATVYLLFATGINADGAIAGWGVHKTTGEIHGFEAIPNRARRRR